MRARLDGKPLSGREGRDFLSPLEQPFTVIFIFANGARAYARAGENNGGVFSRPSRPTRPGDAVGELLSIAWRRPTLANTPGSCRNGATLTFRWRNERGPLNVIGAAP
jgi:hypothetical protein